VSLKVAVTGKRSVFLQSIQVPQLTSAGQSSPPLPPPPPSTARIHEHGRSLFFLDRAAWARTPHSPSGGVITSSSEGSLPFAKGHVFIPHFVVLAFFPQRDVDDPSLISCALPFQGAPVVKSRVVPPLTPSAPKSPQRRAGSSCSGFPLFL